VGCPSFVDDRNIVRPTPEVPVSYEVFLKEVLHFSISDSFKISNSTMMDDGGSHFVNYNASKGFCNIESCKGDKIIATW